MLPPSDAKNTGFDTSVSLAEGYYHVVVLGCEKDHEQQNSGSSAPLKFDAVHIAYGYGKNKGDAEDEFNTLKDDAVKTVHEAWVGKSICRALGLTKEADLLDEANKKSEDKEEFDLRLNLQEAEFDQGAGKAPRKGFLKQWKRL